VPSVSGHSNVAVYTINGVLVTQVHNGLSEQGKAYHKKIEVDKLSAGLYIIQFKNGDKVEFKKFIIAR
jgi:hypothetical protein